MGGGESGDVGAGDAGCGGAARLPDRLFLVEGHVAITLVDLSKVGEQLGGGHEGGEVQVSVHLGRHVKVGVVGAGLDVFQTLLREFVTLKVEVVEAKVHLHSTHAHSAQHAQGSMAVPSRVPWQSLGVANSW